MATRRELYELIGRCATAPTFLDTILSDPIAAARSVDIDLTDDQARWIQSKPQQIANFAKILDGARPYDCGTCILDGH